MRLGNEVTCYTYFFGNSFTKKITQVNKLRNFASINSAVLTSSANKQVSTKSHQSSSESDNNVQYINQVNKQKQAHREEGQTSKQNQPEREGELQPSDALI